MFRGLISVLSGRSVRGGRLVACAALAVAALLVGCRAELPTAPPTSVSPTAGPSTTPLPTGWEWGGSWSGTKDYQHFSQNGH